MKNTNRIHRNGATKTAPVQNKKSIRRQSEFALPAGGAHPSRLAIYDRQGKGLLSLIPLTEKEFTEAQIAAVGIKGRLPEFVAEAVREKLAGANGRFRDEASLQETADEMRQAVNQNKALMDLIEAHLYYRQHEDTDEWSEEKAERFFEGLGLLAHLTTFRLMDASNGLTYLAYPKPAQPAGSSMEQNFQKSEVAS